VALILACAGAGLAMLPGGEPGRDPNPPSLRVEKEDAEVAPLEAPQAPEKPRGEAAPDDKARLDRHLARWEWKLDDAKALEIELARTSKDRTFATTSKARGY